LFCCLCSQLRLLQCQQVAAGDGLGGCESSDIYPRRGYIYTSSHQPGSTV
jgi:hypothetical protein